MGYRRQRLLILRTGASGGSPPASEDDVAIIASAALNTGVGRTTDTLDLIALNDTTLRILPTQQMFFTENFQVGMPLDEAMVSFPQTDFPLAGLGLVADGTYLRYIGYDVNGVVQVGTANFFMNQSVAHLGFVLVKRVAGVTTFVDGAVGPRNVSSSPMMASSSLLERAYANITSNVEVVPNVGVMTVNKKAGIIRAPSVNWHAGANIHEKPVAAQNPASFIRINPATAAAAVSPVPTTIVNAGTFWNGVASVAVPAAGNATVQRWLVGFKGGLWLQEGELVYTNLADAVDNIFNAPFTNLYPADTYAEVARIAIQRNATDLGNNAQSVTVQTGGLNGGGGSGAAGGPVFAEALLGVTIAPNVIKASLNGITPVGGIFSVTGTITATGDISSGAHIIANGGPISNSGIFNATADCYITVNSATGPVSGFLQAQSSGTPVAAVGSITNHPLSIRVNNLTVASFLSTGLNVVTTLDATSAVAASVTLAGGLGVAKKGWFGDIVTVIAPGGFSESSFSAVNGAGGFARFGVTGVATSEGTINATNKINALVNSVTVASFAPTGLSVSTTGDAISSTVASVTLAGGLGVSKLIWTRAGLIVGDTGTDGSITFKRLTDGANTAFIAYLNSSTELRINNAVGMVAFYASNAKKVTVDASRMTLFYPDDDSELLISGTTKGIRQGTNSTGGKIEGVDSTGSGSFQPLAIGGSTVFITLAGSTLTTFSTGSQVTAGNVESSYGGIRSIVGNDGTGGYFGTASNHQLGLFSNNTIRATFNTAGALRLNAYGAGYLKTDASGNVTASATLLAAALEVTGTLKSAVPTGGLAAQWKLGEATPVAPAVQDTDVRVEIDGSVYFLLAHT